MTDEGLPSRLRVSRRIFSLAAIGISSIVGGIADLPTPAQASGAVSPAVTLSLTTTEVSAGRVATVAVAGTTSGGVTDSNGATVIVAQGPLGMPCDNTTLGPSSSASILTESDIDPGDFSLRATLDTDRTGSYQLCALIWNGLAPPHGPILAATTTTFSVVVPPPPPSHPTITSLEAFGDFKRPGTTVALTYDASNNVSIIDPATGDGDTQRELVTINTARRTIRKTLTAWHATPIHVNFRFQTLADYAGSYKWCVVGIGRDGNRSSVRCASFSMRHPARRPRSSGVGVGGAGGSGESKCLVGGIDLRTLGVSCPSARQVYEALISRSPLPTGWTCTLHRCEGPPDFTGLRVSFTW